MMTSYHMGDIFITDLNNIDIFKNLLTFKQDQPAKQILKAGCKIDQNSAVYFINGRNSEN